MQSATTTTALRDHGSVQEWGAKRRKAESREKRASIKAKAIRTEAEANG